MSRFASALTPGDVRSRASDALLGPIAASGSFVSRRKAFASFSRFVRHGESHRRLPRMDVVFSIESHRQGEYASEGPIRVFRGLLVTKLKAVLAVEQSLDRGHRLGAAILPGRFLLHSVNHALFKNMNRMPGFVVSEQWEIDQRLEVGIAIASGGTLLNDKAAVSVVQTLSPMMPLAVCKGGGS